MYAVGDVVTTKMGVRAIVTAVSRGDRGDGHCYKASHDHQEWDDYYQDWELVGK